MSLSGLNMHDHSSVSKGKTKELAAVSRMACVSRFEKFSFEDCNSTCCAELDGNTIASDGEGTTSCGCSGASGQLSSSSKRSAWKLSISKLSSCCIKSPVASLTCCLINKRREQEVLEVFVMVKKRDHSSVSQGKSNGMVTVLRTICKNKFKFETGCIRDFNLLKRSLSSSQGFRLCRYDILLTRQSTRCHISPILIEEIMWQAEGVEALSDSTKSSAICGSNRTNLPSAKTR